MGAAGRDFHNFNCVFRDNKDYNVVAFTAHQIPGIEGRKYPSELAGSLYPDGISIYDESQLERLIHEHNADTVVFSYSDVSHTTVMNNASRAMACGADYVLLGCNSTQLKSSKPVVSVVASRTGCGKSQTSRYIVDKLSNELKSRIVAIRHPMPYGDLIKQKVQRYSTYQDLIDYECTIEEREEYEPYVNLGAVIYAGVDYGEILKEAEKESDIILWDGGNNDMSFIKPELQICVVDPHRVGDEMKYHPGETNVRMSDVLLINKVDTASNESIQLLKKNCKELNPNAIIIEAESPLTIDGDGGDKIKGEKVLVVEDGPTLTHGGMAYGAGMVAAKKYGAKECIDPRPFLQGSLKDTFDTYPSIGTLLPAMGYGDSQIKDLENTINKSDASVVVSGTPIDLSKVVNINKPIVHVRYDLNIVNGPDLVDVIAQKFALR